MRDNRYRIEINVKICRQKNMGMVHITFYQFFIIIWFPRYTYFAIFFNLYNITSSMSKSLWFSNNLLYLQYWSYYFLTLVLDGLFLHELCTENKQCTGTENANVCTTYGNKTQSTCGCNKEYIEIKSKCYKSKISISVKYRKFNFREYFSNWKQISEAFRFLYSLRESSPLWVLWIVWAVYRVLWS